MGVWLADVLSPQEMHHYSSDPQKWPLNTKYQLHGHTLEVVEWGKYLGIHISSDIYNYPCGNTRTNNSQSHEIPRILTKEPAYLPTKLASAGIYSINILDQF